MEDTLLSSDTDIKEFGKEITEDEDMSPCLNSIVVMDWIDAIGGSSLVEHVHRVYGKDLESSTLGSLQSRISKNLDSLLHEIEEQKLAHVNRTEVLNKINNLEKLSKPSSGGFRQNTRQRAMSAPKPYTNSSSSRYCKLCNRNGNHTLAFCPQLSPADRSQIAKVRNVTSSLEGTSLCEPNSDTEQDEVLEENSVEHESYSD